MKLSIRLCVLGFLASLSASAAAAPDSAAPGTLPALNDLGRVPGMSDIARDQVALQQANPRPAYGIDFVADPRPCPGPWCWPVENEPSPSPFAPGLRVIFLNMDGVTLTSGPDNSLQNRSGLINQPTITVPALTLDSFGGFDTTGWTMPELKSYIADLVRLHMTPYNVRVVTERPSGGNYHMVVISDETSCASITTGGQSCIGLAFLDCGDNGNPNNVVFTFAGGLALLDIGTTSSHEFGHAAGLHHTGDEEDIMFANNGPAPPVAFGAGPASGQCLTQPGFQDSDQTLLNNIGPPPPDNTGPLVEIVRPAEGLAVGATSVIEVRTEDPDSAIGGVDLFLNGELFRSADRDVRPFEFILPPSTPEGPLEIRVVARNLGGAETTVTRNISFQRGGAFPCTNTEDCAVLALGQVCDGTQCIDPDPNMPVPGALGAECVGDGDCDQGFCGTLGGESRCSRDCSDDNPCPEGFFCRDGGACWNSAGGGGGCSHGSGGSPLWVLAGLAFFVWRRPRSQLRLNPRNSL